MAKLDMLLAAWDEGHWEFTLGFEELSDECLWQRPHPNLLSIGEIAGHVAYCDSRRTTGQFPDMPQIQGPLIDEAFSYYLKQLPNPVVRQISVSDTLKELARVHQEAKAMLTELDPNPDDLLPGEDKFTWEMNLRYMTFHIGYHTGQVFSARHIFGHKTNDN